jgi:hypothetical protein
MKAKSHVALEAQLRKGISEMKMKKCLSQKHAGLGRVFHAVGPFTIQTSWVVRGTRIVDFVIQNRMYGIETITGEDGMKS